MTASAVAAALAFVAAPAAAAPPPVLHVIAEGCGAMLPEVRELPARLAVELAPSRIVGSAGSPALRVTAGCSAVESLTLEGDGEPRVRTVPLGDVAPELRAVALAVLAAEFIRSAHGGAPGEEAASATAGAVGTPTAATALATVVVQAAPVVTLPAPVTAPPPPVGPGALEAPGGGDRRVALEPVVPGTSRERGPRLAVALRPRYFTDPGSSFLGVEATLRTPAVLLGASFESGESFDSLGRVQGGTVAAQVGYRPVLVSATWLQLSLVGGVELGWSYAHAEPSVFGVSAQSSGEPFASVFAGVVPDAFFGGGWFVTFPLRAGVAHGISVTADSRRILSTQGFFVSGGVGVGYSF